MTMTKSQAAALVRGGRVQEVFTHGTLGSFNITALRQLVAALRERGVRPHSFKFADVRAEDGSADPMALLSAQREIDDARVAELTTPDLEEPVIFVLCPPGVNGEGETHLLVDGIHRMTARHRRGDAEFRFWLIPFDAAKELTAAATAGMVGIDVPWGSKELRDGKLQERGAQKYRARAAFIDERTLERCKEADGRIVDKAEVHGEGHFCIFETIE